MNKTMIAAALAAGVMMVNLQLRGYVRIGG